MNESVPGSVENNGNSTPANVSVNGLLVLPDEVGVGSPQRVESPGGSVHLTRKGFGLKKWRRIKRDGHVKDEAAPVDDGISKLLKRGLTGLVDPPSKHVDLSSVEARQGSEGSVGSVNMVNHHPGVANGFSPDLGCVFTVGQASEKSEEHSGSAIGAKNVAGGKISQGKIRSDTIKKASVEGVNAEKEKPCSSLDSDLRSSDFVFSSGAVSAPNHGEKDERLMMNSIGGFSSEGQVKEGFQTYSRSANGYKEEDGDKSKKNNNHRADKDPLADSIKSFAVLHEALLKEIQILQELGNEHKPLHSNIDELSSPEQPRTENFVEDNSISSGSKVLIMKEMVKHLEHELEETRVALKEKEARIQELENSKIESELEGIFQRKMETEIEHLILTRSLSSQQILQEPKKLHSLTADPESNGEVLLGKTCKLGIYALSQFILLVSILWFLVLKFSPASRLVIPT